MGEKKDFERKKFVFTHFQTMGFGRFFISVLNEILKHFVFGVWEGATQELDQIYCPRFYHQT